MGGAAARRCSNPFPFASFLRVVMLLLLFFSTKEDLHESKDFWRSSRQKKISMGQKKISTSRATMSLFSRPSPALRTDGAPPRVDARTLFSSRLSFASCCFCSSSRGVAQGTHLGLKIDDSTY